MHKIVLMVALTGLSMFGRLNPVAAQSIIHFCGEVLPANHPAIVQKWTQVLSHQAAQASYLTALKHRSAVVFPVIDPIIAKYNIPADFKYLPLVESGAQNFTVSRRGAAGFWQLMPQTARSLGLVVARRHDERYDLRKATNAACRYLRELYDQLGSWTLVAAAYNAGPNYVQALHRRFPDEHALALPYQASETKSYVFQAVALKELFTKPEAYPTYLSDQTIAVLSEGNPTVSEAERLAVLAALETESDDIDPDSIAASDTVMTLGTEPVLVDELAATEPVVSHLETRIISGDALVEGQLCLFEAVRPTTINGVAINVGDLVYAHVETVDAASGRTFLRTEKVVSAQTQEMTKLQLVAVEKAHQPGVTMPTRDARESGWKLNWEQL